MATVPSTSAAASTPAQSTTVKQYSVQDLKTIGQECAGRLPPASAVQAMFLYEMQRDTESERLFHNVLFRLAHAENDSKSQESLIEAQKKRITSVRKQVLELADVETQRHAAIEARVQQLESQNAAVEEEMGLVKACLHTLVQLLPEQTLKTLPLQLTQIHEAIDRTNADRIDLSARLNVQQEMLSKQSDLISCLTLQQASVGKKQKMQQHEACGYHEVLQETRLPVRSIQGRPFELIIPKGYPFPSLKERNKENRRSEQASVMTRPLTDGKTVPAFKGLSHSMFAGELHQS